MTQPHKILCLAVFAAALLLLPLRASAQSGTVTDDGFLSSSSATQQFNLNGQGIVLIVSGSSATVGPASVGTTKTYIKFQLLSSLPQNVAAANVAKATLKLYLSPGTNPSGAIAIYPITSAWTEATLTTSPPSVSSTAFATGIAVGKANSFLVIDVKQLVQEWLSGAGSGGLDNQGIALVAETSTTYVVFDSKESIITSHEPRLELVLVTSGPQGPAGPQGPQGPQGLQGPQGSAGPQGIVGATGATGAQGPIGISNRGTWTSTVQYKQNDAVSDANSFWLALIQNQASEPSLNNPNWQLLAAGINNRGAWSTSGTYNVNDAVTDQDSFWLALQAIAANTPNSEPSSTNTTWQLLAAQGAQGPQGQTGAQGPQGIQGPMGFQGPQGLQGPAGPTGPQGPAGPAGAAGDTGPAGPTGAQGPAGSAGGVSLIQSKAALLQWYRQDFAVGSFPSAVAFDGANIWVANANSNNVSKLRASDGTSLGTFTVGILPHGVAFDGANIWVADLGGNTVTKLRASDGACLGTCIFLVGSAPSGVAFDGANIWVANENSDNVSKLRASDGTSLGTFAVGSGPDGVAFDGANIWVANLQNNTVSKF